MFDVLVYLYETYHRSDACPDSKVLAKKLSAVGFEDDEISRALDWLTDLAQTSNSLSANTASQPKISSGTRIYVEREFAMLGTQAVGFIQFLESAKLIDPVQREIIVERALACSDEPITIDRLKVIVLLVLWSQGNEPEGLMFDELFSDDEEAGPRLFH